MFRLVRLILNEWFGFLRFWRELTDPESTSRDIDAALCGEDSTWL